MSQLLQQNKPVNTGQDGLASVMTIKLDGKKFNLWSQMLKMKLLGKDKLGYINGSILKPTETDATASGRLKTPSSRII